MLRKIYYWLSDVIPGLATILSNIKYKIRFKRPPRKTTHGFMFSGSENMINGTFEVDETNFIIAVSKNYDRFINIGANVGYYIALAQHLKFNDIIAFEPNPMNFSLLTQNSKLSNHTNTSLHNCAVGEFNSELRLYGDTTGASLVPGWSGTSTKNYTTVNVVSLDDYLSTRNLNGNNLILLDIEGFEYQALKGMKKLLHSKKIDLIIEICYTEHWDEKNPYFEDIYKLLNELEYKCYSLHDNSRRLLSTFDEFQLYAELNNEAHNYFFSKLL